MFFLNCAKPERHPIEIILILICLHYKCSGFLKPAKESTVTTTKHKNMIFQLRCSNNHCVSFHIPLYYPCAKCTKNSHEIVYWWRRFADNLQAVNPMKPSGAIRPRKVPWSRSSNSLSAFGGNFFHDMKPFKQTGELKQNLSLILVFSFLWPLLLTWFNFNHSVNK